MATPKDFGAIVSPSFRFNNRVPDIGYKTRLISGRFSAADTMCSGTHFNGTETHADISRILGLEMHHGSLYFRIDFGPLDSASFESDFTLPDTQSDTWVVRANFRWPEIRVIAVCNLSNSIDCIQETNLNRAENIRSIFSGIGLAEYYHLNHLKTGL